jgi:phosphatidylserine synthase 2
MAPLLPNFMECWWDQIFFDLIICNGAGIFVGHKICKYVTGEDEERRGETRIDRVERERERRAKVRTERTKRVTRKGKKHTQP